MFPRSFRAWVLACVCGVVLVPRGATATDTLVEITPRQAVRAALEVSAIVRDARARREAALGLASQTAVSLFNPSISGSASVDGRRASAGVSQPFSLTGEGIAARRAARAGVSEADAALERALLVAAVDVSARWLDARLARLRVEVASRAVALSRRLDRAVTLQAEVGEVAELDRRLARLSTVRASVRLLDARDAEAEALAALAQSTGVVAEPVGDLLDAGPPVDLQQVAFRPDLDAQRAAVERAEASLRRWKLAAMPPMSLGAQWSLEDGEHFVGPSASLTIPLFDRRQADRGAAHGAVDAAVLAERTAVARAEAEISFERRRVAAAEEVLQTIEPAFQVEAEAALRGIELGYESGEFDLPTTLLLQREVLDGLEDGFVLQAGVALARLEWMLAVGDVRLVVGAAP